MTSSLQPIRIGVPESKLRILYFEPCVYGLLEKKGTVSSAFQPGRDLGADLLDRLHYIFPFDVENVVRDIHPRVTIHSLKKGSFHLLHAIRALRYAIDLVRRERIDLVVSCDPYVGGFLGWLAARLTGRKFIIEIMGEYDVIHRETGMMINPALRFRFIENFLCGIVMRGADAAVGYMEVYRQFAIRHGATPGKTYTTYLSVLEYHFDPVAGRGKPERNFRTVPGQKLVAYVGRVDRRKYADCYVAIAERILAARPDVVCLHVGDGPDRERIEAEAARRGIADRFHVTGFLDNREVWKLYGEIDVFAAILAGSSLVEAAAAARPIVAFDTDWHGEFVKDGENGLLAPFRDHDRFAAAVLRLLDDPALARRLGDAARVTASGRHSLQSVMATRRFLYKKIINRPDYCRETGMPDRFT